MSCAIAIFVKTPGLSVVKSRLAAGIGEEAALRWYQLAAAAVSEVANLVTAASVYWAVAEDPAMERSVWRGNPCLGQGPGGLDERMARVHEALVERHGSAILLGADSPQLRADDLRSACDWLRHEAPRQVLGPACDGGFWLYGSNRRAPTSWWGEVEYSRSDTRAQFEARFTALGDWLRLRELRDVDCREDLEPCLQALQLGEATPAQSALAAWMMSTSLLELVA